MNTIWFKEVDLVAMKLRHEKTLVSHLGIEITKVGEDYLEGQMPVDERTIQPFKLLHGGASCVLSETLGSIAANLCINPEEKMAVGQHIEATHLKPATKGYVKGIAKVIHLGRSSHTWKIEIYNDENKLICDSKIIMAIINRR